MRAWILAAALLAGACSVDTDGAGSTAGGYTLEVRANENEQVFLVTAPDGRVTAARAADGASALLDAEAIHALAATPATPAAAESASSTTATTANPNTVSVRAPGLSIQASGDDAGEGKDGEAHVAMNFGGHGMTIDASGHGENDGAAHVVITGADERAVRNFIAHADEISPDVQARMLAALGLN